MPEDIFMKILLNPDKQSKTVKEGLKAEGGGYCP